MTFCLECRRFRECPQRCSAKEDWPTCFGGRSKTCPHTPVERADVPVANQVFNERALPIYVCGLVEWPTKLAQDNSQTGIVEQEAKVCMPDLRHSLSETRVVKVVHEAP
eukprot:353602-Prymnesium_polylepis.3